MTPLEKAEELTEKIYNESWCDNYRWAKTCALIAVNEIINSNPHSNPLNTEVYSTMKWWQEVKKEIEKQPATKYYLNK
jgi:hypothetical protein